MSKRDDGQPAVLRVEIAVDDGHEFVTAKDRRVRVERISLDTGWPIAIVREIFPCRCALLCVCPVRAPSKSFEVQLTHRKADRRWHMPSGYAPAL